MKKYLALFGILIFTAAGAEDCKDKKVVAFTQDLKDAHELCSKHNNNNRFISSYTSNGLVYGAGNYGYDPGFMKCEAIDAAYQSAKTADEKSRFDVLVKDHPEWLE